MAKRKKSLSFQNQDVEYKNIFKVNFFISKNFKLTQKQIQLKKLIEEKQITFIKGCWGTAKTTVSIYTALSLYLENHSYNKIILTKPIVESHEKLGFLPGEIDEKTSPFAESYYNIIEKLIGEAVLNELKLKKVIQFKPIAYMRGDNFDDAIIILDEAQNTTDEQMITFMTRLGKTSKMIIVGDKYQSDIPEKKSAFTNFWRILENIDDIGFFEFVKEDIMRSPILIEITERYEKYIINKKIEKTIL